MSVLRLRAVCFVLLESLATSIYLSLLHIIRVRPSEDMCGVCSIVSYYHTIRFSGMYHKRFSEEIDFILPKPKAQSLAWITMLSLEVDRRKEG